MTKIIVYIQDQTINWLKLHPQQKWRCDIYPSDGGDHHGTGRTEAEALLNASMQYAKTERRT